MNFWDKQYSAVEGYKYGTRPNAYLMAEAHRLPRHARILVPGDGEGRNGVWLASQGHDVLTVDLSEVGVARARALAAERAVSIDTLVADLKVWTPPAGAFDAVVLTYLHMPPAMRAAVHRSVAAALRPGGLLLLEAFHPRQLGRASGGPKEVELLYTLDDVRADFADRLDEEFGEEGEALLDEGPGHQGMAVVTRYRGRAR
ncbi:MAG: class I SAM-dependent methyltransferase [Betaproteobacteria bacterium]